ncbi:MAG: membrane protein insertase YidC, partial [Gammaproteobacteria bacterium]
MDNQRLFLYIALGFVSLLLYQSWVADYHTPAVRTPTEAAKATGEGASTAASDTPGGVAASADLPGTAAADDAVAADAVDATLAAPAVTVRTDVIDTTISTRGATITRVALLDYPIDIDEPDVPLELMSNEPGRYMVLQSGLQSREGVAAPTHREPYTVEADSYVLADGEDSLSVPFVWEGANGVKVVKTLTFHRNSYQVEIDYRIQNASGESWPVNQYRQIKRKPATKDERQQFMNTYIGGVLSTEDDTYDKIKFGDMQEENLNREFVNGWVAMIQHYFAAALIPTEEGVANTAYTRYLADENRYLIG